MQFRLFSRMFASWTGRVRGTTHMRRKAAVQAARRAVNSTNSARHRPLRYTQSNTESSARNRPIKVDGGIIGHYSCFV